MFKKIETWGSLMRNETLRHAPTCLNKIYHGGKKNPTNQNLHNFQFTVEYIFRLYLASRVCHFGYKFLPNININVSFHLVDDQTYSKYQISWTSCQTNDWINSGFKSSFIAESMNENNEVQTRSRKRNNSTSYADLLLHRLLVHPADIPSSDISK